MKIFICHYPKLKERIDYLIPALKSVNFNDITTINGISREEITEDHKKLFVNDINLSKERKEKYNIEYSTHPGCDIRSDWCKPILANFLTHIEIWQRVSESNEPYCLVLEDDARLVDNFEEKWNILISQIPTDLDIAYLHEGCGLTVQNVITTKIDTNQIFYKCPKQISRTCCSYILSKNFSIKLLKDLYPILMSVDHEMNYLQKN